LEIKKKKPTVNETCGYAIFFVRGQIEFDFNWFGTSGGADKRVDRSRLTAAAERPLGYKKEQWML